MLLWITFGVITLIGILLLVLGLKEVFYTGDADEVAKGVGCGIIGLNGFVLFVLSIITITANACPQVQLNEWQEEVVFLQNDRAKLEAYHLVTEDNGKTTFTSDITFETVSTNKYYEMINKYNEKVKRFKLDKKNGKALRNNPWVNCLVWAAYDEFDLSLLDNLEYSIGK